MGPAGDKVADDGSDWRKETGDEGGAMKGRTNAGGLFWFSGAGASDPGNVGSGTRTA